jgi:hypothetical protein
VTYVRRLATAHAARLAFVDVNVLQHLHLELLEQQRHLIDESGGVPRRCAWHGADASPFGGRIGTARVPDNSTALLARLCGIKRCRQTCRAALTRASVGPPDISRLRRSSAQSQAQGKRGVITCVDLLGLLRDSCFV